MPRRAASSKEGAQGAIGKLQQDAAIPAGYGLINDCELCRFGRVRTFNKVTGGMIHCSF
jgi:hypothetical protein